MVRGTEFIGFVKRRLVEGVVVEGAWLIRVDMPECRAGDARQHARVRQRVIEIARFGKEVERVSAVRKARAGKRLDEVEVAGRLDRGNRVFHGVCIQVAEDQGIVGAAAGRVRGEPVDQCYGGFGTHAVAVTLAVVEVGITNIVAV